MDEDACSGAKQELKRVDHLIFVSLKYTRTVDVLKNVIGRLINSYDFIVDCLLEKAREEKRIASVPTAPKLKIDGLRELYSGDKKVMEMLDLYVFLRLVDKAEYEAEQEYRRHVTMKAKVEGKSVDINIDIVTEYYKNTQDFVEYLEHRIKG